MKKFIFSVYFILHLMQPWNIGVHADGAESDETNAKNAIAKVVGVKTGHDEWISAERDDSSPSGYAINLREEKAKYRYMVYVYARIREQPHFRKFLWASSLCYLFPEENPRESELSVKKRALSRQLAHMIFTGFNNETCKIQENNSPISSTANLYIDRSDLILPETRNYDLSINLINREDNRYPDTKFIFQVNVSIQMLDGENGKSLKGKSGYQCLDSDWNYWILQRACTALESIESMFGLAK